MKFDEKVMIFESKFHQVLLVISKLTRFCSNLLSEILQMEFRKGRVYVDLYLVERVIVFGGPSIWVLQINAGMKWKNIKKNIATNRKIITKNSTITKHHKQQIRLEIQTKIQSYYLIIF